MTRTRGFPIARRGVAVIVAVIVVGLVGQTVWASPSSKKAAAQRALKQAQQQLAGIQTRLNVLYAELAIKTRELDKAEADLNQVLAEIAKTRRQLEDAQAEYDEITARLNERAVQAYMNGPGSSLDFLLGATSLTDLSDRLEFVDAVAQDDSQLAAEVQSLRNVLIEKQADLKQQQVVYAKAFQEAKDARARVAADLSMARTLENQAQRLVSNRKRSLANALREYRQSLIPPPSGSTNNAPLPPGYEHVLQVCPVDQPRSYWDGFGAPRFAGGFHLHKGVDIMAPPGTPIRAPFDGYASKSYNSLGGYVVFVTGRYGRVYNAHLSRYSSNSTGPVQTGTIIGYVGDTGDAKGSPHDHFEFHPNVMPSGWPVSSYGYSIIDDAVNPYPLLVPACG
jgi:murein DD-endopeptidase MepM/ murein hydrolase activator NlpD